MKPKIQIDLTPITEEHLVSLGFEKINDEHEEGSYAYMLKLPKNNIPQIYGKNFNFPTISTKTFEIFFLRNFQTHRGL